VICQLLLHTEYYIRYDNIITYFSSRIFSFFFPSPPPREGELSVEYQQEKRKTVVQCTLQKLHNNHHQYGMIIIIIIIPHRI